MATNLEVKLKKNESVDHLIKRSIKKCKKQDIIKEYLESMDPERALHIQKVAYMIKEEALHDARSLSKKFFRDGVIVGLLLSAIIFIIVRFFGVI